MTCVNFHKVRIIIGNLTKKIINDFLALLLLSKHRRPKRNFISIRYVGNFVNHHPNKNQLERNKKRVQCFIIFVII